MEKGVTLAQSSECTRPWRGWLSSSLSHHGQPKQSSSVQSPELAQAEALRQVQSPGPTSMLTFIGRNEKILRLNPAGRINEWNYVIVTAFAIISWTLVWFLCLVLEKCERTLIGLKLQELCRLFILVPKSIHSPTVCHKKFKIAYVMFQNCWL